MLSHTACLPVVSETSGILHTCQSYYAWTNTITLGLLLFLPPYFHFASLFPMSLLKKWEQHNSNSRHDSLTLTLHIMALEASDVRVASLNAPLQRAAGKEHDGAKMKQGVLVTVEKWEFSHQCTELTRVLELLKGWSKPEERCTHCSHFHTWTPDRE